MNSKLTINFGLRLERETGMNEKSNQQTVTFDQGAVNPLNSQVDGGRPGHRREAADSRRPRLRRGQRRADGAGQPAGDQDRAARRRRLQLRRQDRAARRLGPLLLAVELPRRRHDRLGPDRLLGDDQRPAVVFGCADGVAEQPVPVRPGAADRAARSASRPARAATSTSSTRTRGRRACSSTRSTCSASWAAASASRSATPASPESNLGWGGSTNALININQLDPKYQSLAADYTLANVPNPFFGVASAGQFAGQAQSATRPAAAAVPGVRQRLHAAVDRRALAVSRRHLPDPQARHRPGGAATSATPTAA